MDEETSIIFKTIVEFHTGEEFHLAKSNNYLSM